MDRGVVCCHPAGSHHLVSLYYIYSISQLIQLITVNNLKVYIMKKIELTYEEIELLQFLLGLLDLAEYYIDENLQEKIDALQLKLIAMRAQLEYPRVKAGE